MLKGFNGILSSKIQGRDGLLRIFSLGKAINFYNFVIVQRVRLCGSVPLKLQPKWMGLCQQEKQTGTEGGNRVKGDSNTIPKNRLYLLRLCLTGFLGGDPGDSRFQRALANGSWCQKSFSKSLSLSNWLPHCGIVRPLSKCSGSRV